MKNDSFKFSERTIILRSADAEPQLGAGARYQNRFLPVASHKARSPFFLQPPHSIEDDERSMKTSLFLHQSFPLRDIQLYYYCTQHEK